MAEGKSSEIKMRRGQKRLRHRPKEKDSSLGWEKLLSKILRFRNDRDWEQFHTPKNLAAAIAIEAAELQEHFLWKSDAEIDADSLKPDKRKRVIEELADVIIFSLLLAARFNVNIDQAIRRKLAVNAKKYPVSKARGNARKYTEFVEV